MNIASLLNTYPEHPLAKEEVEAYIDDAAPHGEKKQSLLPLPVHRLPPELLGYIFEILTAAEKAWLKSEYHPALAISWVCRRWRDIATSTPSIWSSIMIPFRVRGKQSYRQLHSLVQLFLERAKKRPLTLILNFNYYPNHMRNTAPILKTLVRYCEQWHTAKFHHIQRGTISHKLFNPIAGRLPILKNLAILHIDGEWGLDDSGLDLFRDTPALTSLAYEPFGPLTPPSPLPWGQIRSVLIQCTYGNELVPATRKWTNVEHLTFKRIGGDDGEDIYIGQDLNFPTVTHFSIAVGKNPEAEFAFRYLTLRRLSSLEISSAYSDPGWHVLDQQTFTNFLTRSACRITSLSLKRVPIRDEELIQVLQLMPMLKSLQVEEKPDHKPFSDEHPSFEEQTITERFLRKLTIDNHDESALFLPKLTDIGLSLFDHGLAEWALPTALLSRWIMNDGDGSKQSVECIRSIDIVFAGRNEEPVEILKEKLQPLIGDAGVWMSVRAATIVVKEDYW